MKLAGRQGIPGRDGRDGCQGVEGPQGIPGPQGPEGPEGKSCQTDLNHIFGSRLSQIEKIINDLIHNLFPIGSIYLSETRDLPYHVSNLIKWQYFGKEIIDEKEYYKWKRIS